MAIRLRHPGTGVWYTNSIGFREWLTGEKGKLWLHGIRKFVLNESFFVLTCLFSGRWENGDSVRRAS